MAATAGPLTMWQEAQGHYRRATGRTLYVYQGENGLLCVTSPRAEGGLFRWPVRGTALDRLVFAGKTWSYIWFMWLNGAWR